MNKSFARSWAVGGTALACLMALTACPAPVAPAPEAPAAPAADGTPAEAAPAAPAVATPQTTHVMTHPSQGEKRTVDGAQATLVRTDKGAMVSVSTKEMTPGHVYTLWVIVMNKPEACATQPCTTKDLLGPNQPAVMADAVYGDGSVASANGELTLTAWLPAGNWPGSWYGAGMTNVQGAEIHATINDHGPVIAGQEHAMLTSYRHGCTDESLPPPFPPAAKADGAAGPNKCALTQFFVFTP